MGAVGLIVAACMIVHEDEKVSLLALGFGETALHEQASLRQSQGRRFFLNFIWRRNRNIWARETRRMCRCHAVQERCS
jgi:hypothetical protein